jgi:anti-sigma regulatory factor (Ser/Thr protein kinase)
MLYLDSSPPVGAQTLRHEFPCTPRSVAAARHALDGVQVELGDPVHMTAVLLVSELVTNSVVHAQPTNGVIELVACITPDLVRVEVSDDGEGFDPQPLPHDDAESGRGLELVQELADRWGRPPGPQTSVWFELDRAAELARNATGMSAATPSISREPRLVT